MLNTQKKLLFYADFMRLFCLDWTKRWVGHHSFFFFKITITGVWAPASTTQSVEKISGWAFTCIFVKYFSKNIHTKKKSTKKVRFPNIVLMRKNQFSFECSFRNYFNPQKCHHGFIANSVIHSHAFCHYVQTKHTWIWIEWGWIILSNNEKFLKSVGLQYILSLMKNFKEWST